MFFKLLADLILGILNSCDLRPLSFSSSFDYELHLRIEDVQVACIASVACGGFLFFMCGRKVLVLERPLASAFWFIISY